MTKLFATSIGAVICSTSIGLLPLTASAAAPTSGTGTVDPFTALSAAQRSMLLQTARDTWKFVQTDVDRTTHLPMDNLTYAGGSARPTSYGRYTSAANIGVYLWSVVAAKDLGLINQGQATKLARETLSSVSRLDSYKGFLFQWYDTTNGKRLTNPGQSDCPANTPPSFDNCSFISNVDNGWFASGLIMARQSLPGVKNQATGLLSRMDFSIFYDGRPQTSCNVNPAIPGHQPTGQMYGGVYAGLPPDQGTNWTHYYHNGALYSDPRISAYIGMGLHQMPGDVWWRSWRTLPPKAPSAPCQQTDPDFSWQGQWPVGGTWQVINDPVSHKPFNVWEGHYTYPGSDLRFIPTYGGGMFEALMANEIVPETSWGKSSLGLADVRTVDVARRYTAQQLHLPVWGMSPSSTPNDQVDPTSGAGGYATYGVEGLKFPYFGAGATSAQPNQGLSQCHGCATEDVVTPHASFLALDVAPQAAMANIEALRTRYPSIYGVGGFFDSVDPVTGSVGHHYLILDQSMIMASLANALDNRSMQRHFAADPISWAARTYLGAETMSILPSSTRG